MKLASLYRPDVLGVFVGVIGIILAFIFYVRSKERVRPVYAVMDQVIIGGSERLLPDTVEIRYKGRRIPTLYRAVVFFWNRGSKTLDQSDIASTDPITFHLKGEDIEILEVRSVKATRTMLNASAIPAQDDIRFSFEFLAPGDGAAIEILYTGQEEAEISCSGTVKDARKGISERGAAIPADELTSGRFAVRDTTRILAESVALIALGLVGTITSFTHKNGHLEVDHIQLLVSIIGIGLGLVFLIYAGYYYRIENIPRSLRRIGKTS
jgi:hypothetical protein